MLTCETGGLEHMTGEEVPNGVVPVHNAIARLADRGVVHCGMAMVETDRGYRGLVNAEVKMSAQHN